MRASSPPPFDPPRPPEGEVIYQERRFELRRCRVPLRGGGEAVRGVVVHPGAVVILPVHANGDICLIKNLRWQVGRALLELPAGTREPSEPIEVCARRELLEEAGLEASRLEPLPPFFAAPGGSTEVLYPFLATGLTAVGQRLEADEQIEVCRLTAAEARAALLSGALQDAKSVATLARYFLDL
jgi:8-oxo-dGTP pyrophosphatase MutT (NUDIX family)